VKTEIPPTPGVLLAGGLARRMGGGDKPMRQIAGRTILDRVIARIQPQCDGLILNANGDPTRFASFGLPVIADTVKDFPGPLAGILASFWGIILGFPVLRLRGDYLAIVTLAFASSVCIAAAVACTSMACCDWPTSRLASARTLAAASRVIPLISKGRKPSLVTVTV